LFTEHHLSHAAASFLPSPYEKSAILTIDGVGEWACTTIGVGIGNKIKIIKEINFPHSLGLLYSAFTAFLGFKVNEGEYKVMGMAPYGQPKYVNKVKKLIKFFDDGSYALDLKYFSFHRSNTQTYSKEFVELFGKPRDPKSKFFTRNTGWPSYFGPKPPEKEFEAMAETQEYYAGIAASIQKVTFSDDWSLDFNHDFEQINANLFAAPVYEQGPWGGAVAQNVKEGAEYGYTRAEIIAFISEADHDRKYRYDESGKLADTNYNTEEGIVHLDVNAALREEHLLAAPAGENVVRLLPPLNSTDEDIAEAIQRVSRAAAALSRRS